MAFELTTELESGVVGNYWKMLSATVACIDVPVVTVYMELYVSRDFRLAGKAPIKQTANTFPMTDVDMSISYDFRVCLYQSLKNIPEWANAVDVFDDPNKVPVAYPVSVNTDYNTAKTIRFTAYDNFNLPLTYSVNTQPENGSITENNGVFTYTPNTGFYGNDIATYVVSNGEFTCDPVNININVVDTPDRPTASNTSAEGTINNPVTFSFAGNDPNGLPLTYSIVDNPTNGVVSEDAGIWSYTPNLDFSGSDIFTYKVNNGTLDSVKANITINIFDDRPTVLNITAEGTVNNPVTFTLSGNDPNGLTLTYSIVDNPVNGTVSEDAGLWTYQPNLDFVGTDTFTYKAANGNSESLPANITINILEA